MNAQFELFALPSTSRRAVPSLSPLAIAYVVELDAACDRAGLPKRGRADFIRSYLRLFCDAPFSNRCGLSREITRTRIGFESLPGPTRIAVDRLRPQVAEAIKRMTEGMFQ